MFLKLKNKIYTLCACSVTPNDIGLANMATKVSRQGFVKTTDSVWSMILYSLYTLLKLITQLVTYKCFLRESDVSHSKVYKEIYSREVVIVVLKASLRIYNHSCQSLEVFSRNSSSGSFCHFALSIFFSKVLQ